MKKKYQVFLSSTYHDLKEERRAVMEALLEMDFIPCGMELFPAADETQWSLIKRVVDECDYYVVVVAGRYGSLGPESKSYTQMEYEYAIAKNKPVIAFIHQNIDDLPNNKCEKTDDGRARLFEFRKLCQQKMCKYWSNTESLAGHVTTSLNKLVQAKPAVGWVRSDELPVALPKLDRLTADNFFYTLDDRLVSNFPDLVKGATGVSLLARTAVNLLGQYERVFEELGRNGCKVNLLYICPESEAVKYVYGSDPVIFEENVRKMRSHLQRLKIKMGNLLEPKVIQHAPTMSLILIQKPLPEESFIVVQLYFLHSRVARDRPLFQIYPHEKWYSAFREEFDQLWKTSDPAKI